MGNLSLKKCSLKIDPLQQSDQGPFAFRIEIATFNKFSYFNGKVSITTLSKYQVFYYDVLFFFINCDCFFFVPLWIIDKCELWVSKR